MDKKKFISLSIAYLGTAINWQIKIAKVLGVNVRTIQRWRTGENPIPQNIAKEFEALIGGDKFVTTRGPWLSGKDEAGREYVIHTHYPRFIARVVIVDNKTGTLYAPADYPADTTTGVVYKANDDGETTELLCEIEQIDKIPIDQMTDWLEEAADFLERLAENSTEKFN